MSLDKVKIQELVELLDMQCDVQAVLLSAEINKSKGFDMSCELLVRQSIAITYLIQDKFSDFCLKAEGEF